MDISFDEHYLWYYEENGDYVQVRDPRDTERYEQWNLWHGGSDAYGKKWYNTKWKDKNKKASGLFKLEGLGNVLLLVGGYIILEKVWK